jgi:hypothetical protein
MTVAVPLSLTAVHCFLFAEMAMLKAIDLRSQMVCRPTLDQRDMNRNYPAG